MAEAAHAEHPLNARALYQVDDDGERLLAIGGAVSWVPGDGFAFAWMSEGLQRRAWRTIVPAMLNCLWGCHERGMRRIFALVRADWAQAITLARHLQFGFYADDSGFPDTTEPTLRYLRAWPPIEEPHLIRFQRLELERACLATWCPELVR